MNNINHLESFRLEIYGGVSERLTVNYVLFCMYVIPKVLTEFSFGIGTTVSKSIDFFPFHST